MSTLAQRWGGKRKKIVAKSKRYIFDPMFEKQKCALCSRNFQNVKLRLDFVEII